MFSGQARALSVDQVLFGWYAIPFSMDNPIDYAINPLGDELRSEPRYVPAKKFQKCGKSRNILLESAISFQ